VTNNRALIFLFSGLLAFGGPVGCGHAASEQKASYGTRVKYRLGQKIEFPDFTLEYVGERRKSVPVYPRGFLYYDFKVSKGKVEKVVSRTTAPGILVRWTSKSVANIISSNCAIRISSEN
jgi:hypothetical protein